MQAIYKTSEIMQISANVADNLSIQTQQYAASRINYINDYCF